MRSSTVKQSFLKKSLDLTLHEDFWLELGHLNTEDKEI